MRDAIVRFLIATSVLTAAGMVVFWTGFLWNHTKTQGGIMVGFGVESGCRELPQGTAFEPVMSVQRRLEIIVRAKIAHRCDARLEGTAEERNGEIFLIATDPTGRPLDSKGLGGCMCEKTLVYRLKAAGIRKPGSFSLVFGERVVGRVKEG